MVSKGSQSVNDDYYFSMVFVVSLLNKKRYVNEIGHKWKFFQIPLRLKFSNAFN